MNKYADIITGYILSLFHTFLPPIWGRAWVGGLLLFCSLTISADKYQYFYIEAVRQQDMGNYANAFQLYQHCHELRPDAPETNYALGIFYQALQKDSIGVEFLKKAAEADSLNSEFGERLAQTYLYQNNVSAATQVYERLANQQPERTDYLDVLLRIYKQQKDYTNVLAILHRMEIQDGASEELTLEKMQAHTLMNDNNGAYNDLKSLIDAHPFDLNLQVMLGNWYLNNKQSDKAFATYQKVLKEEPNNTQCLMSLMNYYNAKGDNVKADNVLYNMLTNPHTDSNTRVDLIRSWVKDNEDHGGDSLRVIQTLDKVLSFPQKTSEVAELKAAYLELKKAPTDSIRNAWKKVLEITPENLTARLKVIQIMWEDTVDDKVIAACQNALEYIPNEPMLYYYLGLAQYINKRNHDAVSTLKRGASHITKDTEKKMSSDIYALLGDIYQRDSLMKEAYAAYDSCLVYNPDNVMCLNNYAYFLSEEGKELKKAEQMSYRAITADATNATYLDTYAWILYKEGRYDDAKAYIDMALEHLKAEDDPDGTITKHAEEINKKINKE